MDVILWNTIEPLCVSESEREREVGGWEQALFKKLEDHGAVVMQRGGFVCLCAVPPS